MGNVNESMAERGFCNESKKQRFFNRLLTCRAFAFNGQRYG
jgi:hypothetical protein